MPDLQEVYRQRADDCRRQATKTNNATEETLWLAIAQAWLKLADGVMHGSHKEPAFDE
jgi:hypothetical protein